jgi:hypothetical protein
MAYSVESVRQVDQELLLKADVLAQYLRGLAATDAERAKAMLGEITARLRDAVSPEAGFEAGSDGHPFPDRRSPSLVASRPGGAEDVEEFILENLANNARGLSVQDIVDDLAEADIKIKRPTLVVRLHRLVQAGKLRSRTHGHYVLSEAEHDRRKSA